MTEPHVDPDTLSSARLETDLEDRKPLMNEHEALAEANRCLYCVDAPCIPSCPTAIDIPEFIRQISTGNLMGSAKTILESNILGYSCARVCPVEVLCEGTCVYNEMDEKPIQIGRLQRVATEVAYERGERFFEAGPSTGKRVAIIGAGPAGLACAHELRVLGHDVVIYEGRELPGGLNTTGVAPYKLHADDSIRELEYVLGIGGVELKTGVWIGSNVSVESLAKDHDAVFVGAGLGPDGVLDIPGKDLEGVVGAVKWIEQMKLEDGYTLPDGLRDAAIIGGGNTAIDVVRELCGLGVPNVNMIYRRDEASMSGYSHEWYYAKVEGARGVWHAQPVAFVGDDDGHVKAVRCVRTEVGDDGRLRNRDGDEFEVPATFVALAVGQSKLEMLFKGIDDIEFQWGRFVIDEETGQTGNSKFFAGGDCANGGKEVVNASAEGKRAARGIDAMLRG